MDPGRVSYVTFCVSLISLGLVWFFFLSLVLPFAVFILRQSLVLHVLLGLCKMTGSQGGKRSREL